MYVYIFNKRSFWCFRWQKGAAQEQQSWTKTDLLACQKYLCARPSLFCSMQRNPVIYLHKDFAYIRGMISWRWPLFGPHSLSMNPSETKATAGGLKNQPRSPPSAATIGAAARRLGKVWQLKSIQGSVNHRPCVPCLPHQWGGGGADGRERERNMFGLQISLNIGCMTHGGVWEKGDKTSSRGDDDDATPRPSIQSNYLHLMKLRFRGRKPKTLKTLSL